jgi:hypothetical protein
MRCEVNIFHSGQQSIEYELRQSSGHLPKKKSGGAKNNFSMQAQNNFFLRLH